MVESVMLFAAGFGTRMKHLTRDRPKPMVEVAGVPLIDHALSLATDCGADNIVVNLHYKAEILQHHLSGRGVQTIVEEPTILDTGGGLRNALPLLGPDPVMTLNTDAIWGGDNPLDLLRAAWRPDHMEALLMCIPPQHCVGYQGKGNFVADAQGRITRGDGVVYGGAQIIKTDRLHDIREDTFSLNVLWDQLIAENSLYAITYGGKWCDVGHPEGVTLAEGVLEYRNG